MSAPQVRPAHPPLTLVRPQPDASSMLSALPIPCVLLDAQNRFVTANPAAEVFLTVSISQLRHLSLGDLVGPDCALFALIAQARRDETVIIEHDLLLESPRLRRSGVTVQAVPVTDQRDGEASASIMLTFQDESAARALDRHLSFRHAARSVAGMAEILAHEVKNPLSGIRGAAQLLENTVGDSDRELAILIREEADRIRALVDRMGMFGEAPVSRDAVNIHRVLEHVRRLAQTGFAAHLRINEAYDPSLPPVWGNRDQLVQVLLNLVKNAAESITDAMAAEGKTATAFVAGAVPCAGEITLMTAYQHGMRMAIPGQSRRVHLPLAITVRDTGPGIPPAMRDTLFDPFATSKPTGTGLGLALVAKIVGEHGGLMEVDSHPGRTDFRLFLPVFPEDSAGSSLGRP
jgi:two-component system nitrogen regulation sensor histidine kinase GlnL